jgi:hypothetical protein
VPAIKAQKPAIKGQKLKSVAVLFLRGLRFLRNGFPEDRAREFRPETAGSAADGDRGSVVYTTAGHGNSTFLHGNPTPAPKDPPCTSRPRHFAGTGADGCVPNSRCSFNVTYRLTPPSTVEAHRSLFESRRTYPDVEALTRTFATPRAVLRGCL